MLFSLESERAFDNEIRNTPANVGPGMYNIVPKMGKSGKSKAPFGTRADRQIYQKPEFVPPPPGEYNPRLSSGVGITSAFKSEAQRRIFAISTTPAPTAYHCTHPDTKKKPVIALNRFKGPATAKPPTQFVGQDVLCFVPKDGEWIPRKIVKRGPEFVGPGSYDPELPAKDLGTMKSFDRGAVRQIFQTRETFPGPGAYSSQRSKLGKVVAIRDAGKRDITIPYIDTDEYLSPTPWTYEVPESSACFRSRDTRAIFLPGEETPGPTTYSRMKHVEMNPGDGFGRRGERNSLLPLDDGPGPGAYCVPPKPWLRTGKSTSKGVDIEKVKEGPGPGTYELGKTWGSTRGGATSAFACKASRKEVVGNGNPGPGRYMPRINDREHAVAPLIRETRFSKVGDWIDPSKSEIPAPDAYQSITLEPGRKGRTISALTRNVTVDPNPGPGAYNVVHEPILKRSKNAMCPQVPPESVI